MITNEQKKEIEQIAATEIENIIEEIMQTIPPEMRALTLALRPLCTKIYSTGYLHGVQDATEGIKRQIKARV